MGKPNERLNVSIVDKIIIQHHANRSTLWRIEREFYEIKNDAICVYKAVIVRMNVNVVDFVVGAMANTINLFALKPLEPFQRTILTNPQTKK
jgi:hypothetical protein